MRIVANKAPAYNTPYTGEKKPWGGRILLPVLPPHPFLASIANDYDPTNPAALRTKETNGVSVLSYNVLANCNILKVPYCPPTITSWSRRREFLLREIFSVRANVMCFQDVDLFHEWWRPQLSCAGYDSLYKKRTDRSGKHHEGVAIAWKRDMFQLFRSEDLEFNRLAEDKEDEALAAKVAVCDNVALMILLQPWQDSSHPSGLCVVCTQLHDDRSSPTSERVRSLQACGLTRTVEAFNSDFQLPIVLCGTMNCLPSSATYQILSRGVDPLDPSVPGPAGKPLVEPLSTSTARVRWAPPEDNPEAMSPPVERYHVSWVPGGSRFLRGERLSVGEGDCLVYDVVSEADSEDGGGGGVSMRTVQNPLRSAVATGLSSGVAYEFRVSAVNALGEGPQGVRSDPVRMPFMPENDPEGRLLLGAASIRLMREREQREAQEREAERVVDPRAYALRKLVKLDGMDDLLRAEKVNPFASVSGLTPRFSDGSIHPDVANCRTDAGYPLLPSILPPSSRVGAGQESHSVGEGKWQGGGGGDCEMDGELAVQGTSHALIKLHPNLERERDNNTSPTSTSPPGVKQRQDGGGDNGSVVIWSSRDPRAAAAAQQQQKTKQHRLGLVGATGQRSRRQHHALNLRSAYVGLGAGGEPGFTCLSGSVAATLDYIFFSAQSLVPRAVLSLPTVSDLRGNNAHEPYLTPDRAGLGRPPPPGWVVRGQEGKKGAVKGGGGVGGEYSGEWMPPLCENPRLVHHLMPNEIFPSDHLLLMVHLHFASPNCPSTWH
ncbi:unnamed protein product [Discosporangium mesarthrocarpum]